MKAPKRLSYEFVEALEHAPHDAAAYWRFVAALAVRHWPTAARDIEDYESELRFALGYFYCAAFNAPDDQAARQLVEDCLATARLFSRT